VIAPPTRRAALLSSFAAAGMLTLPRRARAVSYQVKAGKDGHFVVKAAIENTEVDAIIDTGASAVVIPAEVADRARLLMRPSDFTIPVSTANGMTKAARVSLRRVEIGNIRVRNVEALVMPKGALDVTLIGMSFLSRLKGFKMEGGILVLDN